MSAMGMCANGASGDTLSEIEDAFGIDIMRLNKFLYEYQNNLIKSSEKLSSSDGIGKDALAKFNIANSIWFKNDENLEVKPDYIQKYLDYYNSEIYKATFDEKTKDNINKWVNAKTDGMIPNIINKINPSERLILLNALCFKADWEDEFREEATYNNAFYCEGGEIQNTEFMRSSENYFIRGEKCKGLIKPYKDPRYAFCAILPDESVGFDEFLASLKGERIVKMLENAEYKEVITEMPKFKADSAYLLNDILDDMEIKAGFNPGLADFKKMAEPKIPGNNIYIGSVIHKTYIEVDEKGTKAAAVTPVNMEENCEAVAEEQEEVILNRPFIYMIIDREANLPIFIGAYRRAQ